MRPEHQNRADRRPQFSLRQLWFVVSVCCLAVGFPPCASLALWLALQVGLTAAALLALIAVQAPCFLLFKALVQLDKLPEEKR